jgi:L-iditol 2-dehydrogenase
MPERNLVVLPQDMSYVHAALAEPVATAMHAILETERLVRKPIDISRVLIIGGGAIGIAAALILNSHGCKNILVGETNPLRRQTVKASGVCEVYDPLELSPDDNSWDVVIDAVGGKASRVAASKAIRPGGMITHIGLMDNEGGLDTRKLTLQEVLFLGCYTYTMSDVHTTVDALANGSLGALDWIEQRPLSEGAQAFSDLASGSTSAAKIILIPD